MKSVSRRHFQLTFLNGFVGKFGDFTALGADQMVMMPAQMTMFVPDRLPVELLFLGKSQFYHSIHALCDEDRVEIMALFFQQAQQFLKGDVRFGSQKDINDIEPFLCLILAVSLYEGSKIGLFKIIVMFHPLNF